ncbi:branched-chain amino acid ABC transporter permease [Pimelobacter simplex]|uniref:branched-chain amino acid ABC transporter permease n=1 Tax=Nocardioides simplex TaxID=2045 RepID=UPI003AB01816
MSARVQNAAGVLGLVLLVVWAGDDLYRSSLLITMLTYALVALGMYVPFVLAGSLSLSYSAYAATGAYAVAIGTSHAGWPLWLGMLVAPPVAAIIAVVLGAATMRLSGFYLGAVTLLFAEAFIQLLGNLGITGGPSGIIGLPLLTFGGWEPTPQQTVLLAVALTAVLALALDRLRRSPWGVVIRASREVPIAVDTAGVSVSLLNLVALGAGAAIASLGGALFTTYVGAVNPETFSVNVIFLAVFMPLIGGIGSPWGAVLGAAIVVHLTLNVDSLASSGTLLVSLSVLVILVLFPRGVLGFAGTARRGGTSLLTTLTKRGVRT